MSQLIVPAAEALRRLRTGNERFARNVRSIDALASQSRRASLAAGQSPFAVILSCSDSRVPSEIVFDMTDCRSVRQSVFPLRDAGAAPGPVAVNPPFTGPGLDRTHRFPGRMQR